MIRVLVFGGRDYNDAAFMFRVLDKIRTHIGISCIIQGECPYGGADSLAKMYAICNGIFHEDYPPEIVDGKILGPKRNAQMIREGRPDLGVGFPGGRGTASMAGLLALEPLPCWLPDAQPRFGYHFGNMMGVLEGVR